MPHPPSPTALAELKAVVGERGFVESAADIAPYLDDFRRLYHGASPLVLMPKSTEEVSRLLVICHRDAIGVVPQGGNTSYCGAATPDASGTQVVVSLKRLHQVRHVDPSDYSMTVEVGVTLAQAQQAAREHKRLFPLSLGSEGTAQIGGNLSTNAGGTAVLRYGMMRDLVLGLEVVLADGRVLNGLKSLRKDNTGYDVKSLFIGAEGTLGIITAASLKIFPEPKDSATALVGLNSPADALELLAHLRGGCGDQLSTFELMPRFAIELTVAHITGVANPLSMGAPWHLLVELTSPNPEQNLNAALGAQLEHAAEKGLILDAMLASSLAQAQSMWKLRESIPEAQRKHGASLKHDVAVPVSKIPRLIDEGNKLIERLAPEGMVVSYGHAGDGNLHFNVSQRPGTDSGAFMSRAHALEMAMFDLVESLGGSISAEHGIGRLKAEEFARRADPAELSVMRALKNALDPKGILNPGKVLCAR
ncbi:MAG TPA: FAD-binding oxidoreductase [Steroidobacteraceae bacterium]|jgi:FAD/FMN-containing dehydrogenase